MILVTGASGFIGHHLLESLAQKSTPIRALYYQSSQLPSFPNVEWKQCNLRDIFSIEEAMQGIRKVYNCAATVSFDPKNRNRLLNDNVEIVANIVNAALESNIERMIHVSSIAALGRSKNGNLNLLIDEGSDFEEGDGNSLYAQGKYYGELEVWRGMAEGLNAAVVNPGIVLGAGDWTKGSSKLIQVVNNEFPWFTEGITSWIGVKDVVNALILLMESDITEERFILSEGNHSYKDVFSKMAFYLNKKPPYKKASKRLTEIIWRLSMLKSRLTKKEPTITKATARAANRQYKYSNRKFLKFFPEFEYTPIDTVIKEMATAFTQSENA